MTSAATDRLTAEERREQILRAATEVFARAGYQGASTEEISRLVGVSQPYIFRLFGTKKALFLATTERCLEDTLLMFQAKAEGLSGMEALMAIGDAYTESIRRDPMRLQAQLQAYAAALGDADVRTTVRAGYGRLVDYVERVSGLPPAPISAFFAEGMLLNVIAALGLQDSDLPWAQRLLEGCSKAAG